MNASRAITVLLAEDHRVVREGLRKLLELESDLEIVGEAATGREAVDMALALRPKVIVMDIAMPRLNGLEATRLILAAAPEIRVLILSAHSDDAYVDRVKELGASGYLVKQTSAEALVGAVREVVRGIAFYSPSIARRYARRHRLGLNPRGGARAANERLSGREAEVLQRIAEGDANKQIAEALGISIKTVEKHRARLMQKLDIHDTASLTRYAIATGVIESSAQSTTIGRTKPTAPWETARPARARGKRGKRATPGAGGIERPSGPPVADGPPGRVTPH